MLYPDRILLKLGAGVRDRIDGCRGGVSRSAFIRSAIEKALSLEVVAATNTHKKSVVREDPIPGAKQKSLPADQVVVLSIIQKGQFSSRDIERKLGWLGLRYSQAERGLAAAGLVEFQDGYLVTVDG